VTSGTKDPRRRSEEPEPAKRLRAGANRDRTGRTDGGRRVQFDVVVVGAGNAALCAALEAGAKVIVLERAPEEESGGNSPFTDGAIGPASAVTRPPRRQTTSARQRRRSLSTQMSGAQRARSGRQA
jgi:choline dehydrogenase-like flavoprotein